MVPLGDAGSDLVTWMGKAGSGLNICDPGFDHSCEIASTSRIPVFLEYPSGVGTVPFGKTVSVVGVLAVVVRV